MPSFLFFLGWFADENTLTGRVHTLPSSSKVRKNNTAFSYLQTFFRSNDLMTNILLVQDNIGIIRTFKKLVSPNPVVISKGHLKLIESSVPIFWLASVL